ncbi:MAG: DNA-3-methyladenine glycosylase [Candidatus Marinimicrobia bacterium]|jgi:DNA-3-methyladenine glycosylase|nr:DNA-3-methyladenine glycosylase [Candidatus Neomarinimicrobiota bacterium]MDP6569441.1 DNA-3-methyladenine glycosylase [Candidatus Neomarinimicrobiota bacterium]MDP7026484.1 DNA-3-methyladenine glycosylase [Candidatus Neomarinimicrobiota bacterium]|tara:strand:+ start:1690 stop:2286 length:597 start_codon:yes stop_codon:yes gene_type:complete
MSKLLREFYVRPNVVQIAKDLLGKYLLTRLEDTVTGGMIVETEAYAGPEDRASHAHNSRRTSRTEIMFHEGGVAYVYLCYGIHHLFNIVTNVEGIPHAVLIRAIEPTDGAELMLRRRNMKEGSPKLSGGPGTLTQALGIKTTHTQTDLTDEQIWLEDRGFLVPEDEIIAGPRVGVSYAGEDAENPWRFQLKNRSNGVF